MQTPTSLEWLKLFLITSAIFLLIAFAEILQTHLKLKAEVTRKIVHIITGLFIFFTPYLFQSSLPPILIAVFFGIFNFLCIRFGYFQSIHTSLHKTYGTVYYPLAFLVLIPLFWPTHIFILQISFLILALADATAAVVGQNVRNPKIYHFTKEAKTIQGSFAFFVVSFFIVILSLSFLPVPQLVHQTMTKIILVSLIAALFTTVLEALSWKGSDNLSVPFGAAFILHFLLINSPDKITQLSFGITLALLVAVLSYRFRFLNLSGTAGTFILGTIIFGIGGLEWAIPILTFFISSSLLSRLWLDRKKKSNLLFEKSSTRDIGQVFANGGIACVAVLLFYVTESQIWFVVFLGVIAAVTADTWATEIGSLSKKLPRLITSWNIVDSGTSGAISLLGILASISGGLFIALVGFGLISVYGDFNIKTTSLIVLAALFASLVDSFLGATFQAQYQCELCHKITERKTHCKEIRTVHVRGLKWLNNDFVNLICAFSGGFFVLMGLQFI